MIKQIIDQLRFFKGKNRLIFILSCIVHIRTIAKDRTILTLKFVRPMKIKQDDELFLIKNYYEIPFYTYDYSLITDRIKKNSLLFDIGAHFGEVTYRFLRQKKGYAYAFEANPNNSRIIKELFSKEKLSNFQLFEFGLGQENKKDSMYLTNPLSYEGSITEKIGKKEDISVKRLDKIELSELKRFKNIFFNIDVEGYEIEVISGMIDLLPRLKKNRKKVTFLIEIKTEENLKVIKKKLEDIFGKIKMKKLTIEDYLFEM